MATASSDWVWNSFRCHCPRPQLPTSVPRQRLASDQKKKKKPQMSKGSLVSIPSCGHTRTPRPAELGPRPTASNPGKEKPPLGDRSQKDEKGFLPIQPKPGKKQWIMLCSETIHPTTGIQPHFSPFHQRKHLAPSSTSLTYRGCSKDFFFPPGPFRRIQNKKNLFSCSPLPKTLLPRGSGKCPVCEAHSPNPTLNIHKQRERECSPGSIKFCAFAKLQRSRPAKLRFVFTQFVPQVEP